MFPNPLIFFLGALLLFVAIALGALLACYKRCPRGKLIVVYGPARGQRPRFVITSQGRFVLPLLQDYAFLSLASIRVPDVGRGLTVKIGETAELRNSAALNLLKLSENEIVRLVRERLKEVGEEGTESVVRAKLNELGLEVVQE